MNHTSSARDWPGYLLLVSWQQSCAFLQKFEPNFGNKFSQRMRWQVKARLVPSAAAADAATEDEDDELGIEEDVKEKLLVFAAFGIRSGLEPDDADDEADGKSAKF
jgi:hypothetical protein